MSLPGIPQNPILQTGNAQNLLTWEIVSGAVTYSVLRSTDGVIFVQIATPVTNYYLDTAVTVGITYYYQVATINVGGTSPTATPYPVSIVPCLPGQMSLGYIRYLAQLRADKLNSQFLTMDEWNSLINQQMYELYDHLVAKYGEDYFMEAPISFVTSGAESYPLPDGVTTFLDSSGASTIAPPLLKLLGVDCGTAVGNTGWVTLPRFNWIDRNRFVYPQLQANALGVFNLSYRQMGNNLWFIPRPASGQQIQLWYTKIVAPLLQDTDMLTFSLSGWSEFLILGTAMHALIKEESYEQANALSTLRDKVIERIEWASSNRDTGQPNTISDTRGNTGGYGGGGFGGNGSGMAGW